MEDYRYNGYTGEGFLKPISRKTEACPGRGDHVQRTIADDDFRALAAAARTFNIMVSSFNRTSNIICYLVSLIFAPLMFAEIMGIAGFIIGFLLVIVIFIIDLIKNGY
jgi:hypothetical protein